MFHGLQEMAKQAAAKAVASASASRSTSSSNAYAAADAGSHGGASAPVPHTIARPHTTSTTTSYRNPVTHTSGSSGSSGSSGTTFSPAVSGNYVKATSGYGSSSSGSRNTTSRSTSSGSGVGVAGYGYGSYSPRTRAEPVWQSKTGRVATPVGGLVAAERIGTAPTRTSPGTYTGGSSGVVGLNPTETRALARIFRAMRNATDDVVASVTKAETMSGLVAGIGSVMTAVGETAHSTGIQLAHKATNAEQGGKVTLSNLFAPGARMPTSSGRGVDPGQGPKTQAKTGYRTQTPSGGAITSLTGLVPPVMAGAGGGEFEHSPDVSGTVGYTSGPSDLAAAIASTSTRILAEHGPIVFPAPEVSKPAGGTFNADPDALAFAIATGMSPGVLGGFTSGSGGSGPVSGGSSGGSKPGGGSAVLDGADRILLGKDPLGIAPLSNELARLNDLAERGAISDNDPRLDQAARDLKDRISMHVPDDAVNEVFTAVLAGTGGAQAISDAMDKADVDALVLPPGVFDGLVPGGPTGRVTHTPGVSDAEMDGLVPLVPVAASDDEDREGWVAPDRGLVPWTPANIWMSPSDVEEVEATRERLGLNRNEHLFIDPDTGDLFVLVNPGANQRVVPVGDWAIQGPYMGTDPSTSLFASGYSDTPIVERIGDDEYLVVDPNGAFSILSAAEAAALEYAIHLGVAPSRLPDFGKAEYWGEWRPHVPSDLLGPVHTLLDVGGMAPVVGEPLDGLNGLIYAAEGDWVNAAISAGALVPGMNLGTGARIADDVGGFVVASHRVEGASGYVHTIQLRSGEIVDAVEDVGVGGYTVVTRGVPNDPFSVVPLGERQGFLLENANAFDRIKHGDTVQFIDDSPTSPVPFDRNGNPPPNPARRPDYLVNGEFVDGYAPTGTNADSALKSGIEKNSRFGQAQRVDIVLDRTSITIEDMREVLAVRYGGNLDHIGFSGNGAQLLEITVLKDGERVVLWTRGG